MNVSTLRSCKSLYVTNSYSTARGSSALAEDMLPIVREIINATTEVTE
jgi:hypothetical protein